MADDTWRLAAAIDAAATLGIETHTAEATRQAIATRSGFPGDLYVLALAGGTGVGKSSLLNALAGNEVSTAGVLRPTTSNALAWVAATRVTEAGPLLDWLGGAQLAVHSATADDPLVSVAIVDLPDLDSMAVAHAARVDAVLPRVDAVLWVTDPEKYADAVLHDRYLRRWLPRLGRQAVALNKTDRLTQVDAARLRADLAVRLGREGVAGVPILLTSAMTDVRALRDWLSDGVTAKEIVTQRLAAAAAAAVVDLLHLAGLDALTPPSPLVLQPARAQALAAASAAVLRVVDPDGLRQQAIAATQAAARGRGGGPWGLLRSLADRGTGVQERHADPAGYLSRWRERGTLAPAAQPIRDMVSGSLALLAASARPGVAKLADTDAIADRLADATDRAIGGPAGRFQAPTSRLWPIIGIGQLAATAAVVAGAIWMVALLASGGTLPTTSFEVPFLGPVPMPACLVIGGLLAWFVLGRLLTAHAARLGGQWATRVAASIDMAVRAALAGTALQPLDAWEQARAALWLAARSSADPASGSASMGVSPGRAATG